MTTRKPRAKPGRTVTLADGVLTLTVGKTVGTYDFARLPSDYGIACRVAKRGGEEPYFVNLDPEDGRHTCECLGQLRHGRCKHVEALFALYANGKMPAIPMPDDDVERGQPWWFEGTATEE